MQEKLRSTDISMFSGFEELYIMKKKNLQLSLKSKWFEMTNPDGKTEDYRSLSCYWYSRLCLFDGVTKSKLSWEYYFENYYSSDQNHRISFKPFSHNVMTLGYPKSTDLSRVKKYKHAGIEIRTGNPDWGAEPGKLYFVIKHGELVTNMHPIQQLSNILAQQEARMSLLPFSPVIMIPDTFNSEELVEKWKEWKEKWEKHTGVLVFKPDSSKTEYIEAVKPYEMEPLINIEL